MKKWLRRFTYLFVFSIWLLVMSFPFLAFSISTRGQVYLGNNPRRHIRLFSAEGEDIGGVGVEWIRPLSTSSSVSTTCTKTNVIYLLWEGESATQNTSFCQCFDSITDAPLAMETAVCD